MRTHIVQGGKIVNTIMAEVAEAQAAFPDAICVDADLVGGSIGDHYDEEGGATTPGHPGGPTEAEIVAAYMAAVQQHMDARAVSFGYDNLISVITYAEEPAVARYQSEGQAFRAWRSACWSTCEQMLAAVKAGDRPAPTHAELVAELPELGIAYSGPFAQAA